MDGDADYRPERDERLPTIRTEAVGPSASATVLERLTLTGDRAAEQMREAAARRGWERDRLVGHMRDGSARLCVLVVDDNLVNQKVATRMLARLGYRSEVVANGVEAVDAVSRVAYAAVLMDCEMPEMDGCEATRRIRQAQPTGDRLPIIAVTALAQVGDRERCLTAGMDDYLVKPLQLHDLALTLERWVRATPC